MATFTAGAYLNFGRILRLGAQKFADRVFLEFEGESFTYAEFNQQVNAMARWLRSTGLSNGDRVLLLAENSPNYVRALFALGKLGVVAMPTNAMLTPIDIARVLDLTHPRHLLASESYVDRLRAALDLSGAPTPALSVLGPGTRVESASHGTVDLSVGPFDEPTPDRRIEDDDPAMILFTSGSTGTPKGIVKSYANIAWSAINHQLSEPRRGGDRESFCLALAGIAFANFVLLDALAGATCVLERRFGAATLAETLRTRGITHIFLAPTMMAAIDREVPGAAFESVRVVETSFEFPLMLRQRACEMFPNAQILWSFGSTEATMARTPPEYLLADVTCVGYAGGLDEYRIDPRSPVDSDGVGEVESFGPTVMMGYLSADDEISSDGAITADGWFRTGDLGRMGEHSALHFAGRVKDMIKTGGTNVFARDVEAALVEHPGVRDAAVIGVADAYWGEAVTAVLEVHEPAGFDVEDVRRFATERLAGYQQPKAYYVVADLPKNPTGKIAKGQLRDDIGSGSIRPSDHSGE